VKREKRTGGTKDTNQTKPLFALEGPHEKFAAKKGGGIKRCKNVFYHWLGRKDDRGGEGTLIVNFAPEEG